MLAFSAEAPRFLAAGFQNLVRISQRDALLEKQSTLLLPLLVSTGVKVRFAVTALVQHFHCLVTGYMGLKGGEWGASFASCHGSCSVVLEPATS